MEKKPRVVRMGEAGGRNTSTPERAGRMEMDFRSSEIGGEIRRKWQGIP